MELDWRDIQDKLTKFTADNSNFDTTRDYISLSHCALTVEELVNQHQNGFEDTLIARLKCYKGYQMEKDLKARVKAIFGDRIEFDPEISLFNAKVKGHPDLLFDGNPGDCKSVLKDDWIPEVGKLPRKVYFQLQAYMLYLKKDQAVVIYESRESGIIKVFIINKNCKVQNEIDQKVQELLNRIAV